MTVPALLASPALVGLHTAAAEPTSDDRLKLDDEARIDRLIDEATNAFSFKVRAYAVGRLGKIGPTATANGLSLRARQALALALDDPHPVVRAMAIHVVGAHKEAAFLPMLHAMADHDQDGFVRIAARDSAERIERSLNVNEGDLRWTPGQGKGKAGFELSPGTSGLENTQPLSGRAQRDDLLANASLLMSEALEDFRPPPPPSVRSRYRLDLHISIQSPDGGGDGRSLSVTAKAAVVSVPSNALRHVLTASASLPWAEGEEPLATANAEQLLLGRAVRRAVADAVEAIKAREHMSEPPTLSRRND